MGVETGRWSYDLAETGARAMDVVRVEPGRDGRSKDVFRDPAGVEGPFLPLGHRGIEAGSRVVIVESEKDRDRLETMGIVATSWPGGAGAWTRTRWDCLSGCAAVLVPDRDEPGFRSMEGLAAHLSSLGVAVRMTVTPDGPADGSNICDGDDEAAIRALIDAAPEMSVKTNAPDENVTAELHPIHCDGPWAPEWWPLSGMLMSNAVSIWHGDPGSGKSLMAVNAMAALLSPDRAMDIVGRKVLPRPIPALERRAEDVEHRVLYVSLEDTLRQVTGRVRAITSRFGLDPAIWERARFLGRLDGDAENKAKTVIRLARELRPTVIFLDNLRRFDHRGEKVDTAQSVIDCIESIALAYGAALALLHHDRKLRIEGNGAKDQQASGAGHLIATARAAIAIEAGDDGTIRIDGGKANHGPAAGVASWKKETADVCGWPVVVAVPVVPESPFKGLTVDQCRRIVDAICAAEPQDRAVDAQSDGWAGYAVASGIGMEPDADLGFGIRAARNRTPAHNVARKRCADILNEWTRNGVLSVRKATIVRRSRNADPVSVYVKGRNDLGDDERTGCDD